MYYTGWFEADASYLDQIERAVDESNLFYDIYREGSRVYVDGDKYIYDYDDEVINLYRAVTPFLRGCNVEYYDDGSEGDAWKDTYDGTKWLEYPGIWKYSNPSKNLDFEA